MIAPSRSRLRSCLDWWFRDRTNGAITIAQFPNPPLWIFLATVAAAWFVRTGSAPHRALEWVGTAALGWWAADEIARGVNPWRRVLGVAGVAIVAARVVSLLS